MLRPLVLATPVIVLALSTSPAHADGSAAGTSSGGGEATLGYPGAKTGAAEKPGAYTHDGFYLRLGLGGGYVHDNLKYEGPTLLGLAAPTGEAQGASFQGDFAAGWAIKPGLVIGGQVYIEQVANPKVTIGGQSYSANVSVGTLTMFGPFIDWYPNAHKGFHFGGMLGVSRITMKDNSNTQLNNEPVGGGGMAFVGYEWWVGKQWAVGLMGQFAGASMNDSSSNIRHTWTSGGLALSVTYN